MTVLSEFSTIGGRNSRMKKQDERIGGESLGYVGERRDKQLVSDDLSMVVALMAVQPGDNPERPFSWVRLK